MTPGDGSEELMIVNPGLPGRPTGIIAQRGVGEPGGLGACRCASDPMLRSECRLGELLLGDDGAVYRVIG